MNTHPVNFKRFMMLLALAGFLGVSATIRDFQRFSGEEPKPSLQSLDGIIQDLRARYPDRESVAENSPEIAAILTQFADREVADREVVSPGGRSEAGKARLLAAEILLLGGQLRDGRDLLGDVVNRGPLDEDRAQALYLLGEVYFFKELYVPQAQETAGSRTNAIHSWRLLSERYPSSPWARRIERPLKYLKLLEGEALPPFREKFSAQGSETECSLDALRGKVVVLDFWRSSTRGTEESERELARDMLGALDKYPDLKGKVEVLGINLDIGRAAFESAVKAWQIPWPQHHDGLQFETPLAKHFGIPREPHRVVIDPEGRLVYMGADHDGFFRALNQELKRVRGVTDPPAAPAEKR